MTAVALVLSLAATLGLFVLGVAAAALRADLNALRLWVLAHDDELDEIAAEEGAAVFADRVRARLRKRGEPVGWSTE